MQKDKDSPTKNANKKKEAEIGLFLCGGRHSAREIERKWSIE